MKHESIGINCIIRSGHGLCGPEKDGVYLVRLRNRKLTSRFMCHMGKEGSDLALGIVNRSHPAELRITSDRVQEHLPGVEALSRTIAGRLSDYPIKEFLSDDICHHHVVRRRGRIAWTFLASLAAVVLGGATVSPLAAAHVG